MSSDTNCCSCPRTAGNVLSILATLLVMGGLVALMRHYTSIPSLAQDRAVERMKILADYKAANEPLLEKYEWQDQAKGVVKIPISRAKELVLQEWANPAVAHSNLMAQAAKAFYVPPPPPPKKNEFE